MKQSWFQDKHLCSYLMLNQHRYKYETKQMKNAWTVFCLGNLKGGDEMGDRDTWENIKRILKKQNARMWIGLNWNDSKKGKKKTVKNLQISWKARKFLPSWATVSFSRTFSMELIIKHYLSIVRVLNSERKYVFHAVTIWTTFYINYLSMGCMFLKDNSLHHTSKIIMAIMFFPSLFNILMYLLS